jgi:uncharacterized phiE125 gp8 family phage protein
VWYSTLRVTSQPAVEPLTLDIVKAHVRIDNDIDDTTLLPIYLATARASAESYLGRALITQTLVSTIRRLETDGPGWHWDSWGTGWPSISRTGRRAIELARAPVQSFTSVSILDDAGTSTPVTANGVCDIGLDPARLYLDWSAVRDLVPPIAWPIQHLAITFTAGYGADGSFVPQPIRNAILLMTAALYERRGDEAETEMPKAARYLLDPYRIQFFGG